MSRSVKLEQLPAVVMANTGDSPATSLKYYAKLPEVAMRWLVENKPVIPSEQVLGKKVLTRATVMLDWTEKPKRHSD